MKFKMGGTLEFNVMARQYESVKVSTTFEVETDNGEYNDDQIEVMNIKINKALKEQLKKKAAIALKSQKDTRENLQKIANMPDVEL